MPQNSPIEPYKDKLSYSQAGRDKECKQFELRLRTYPFCLWVLASRIFIFSLALKPA